MTYHVGMKFSTKDRDNDISTSFCAQYWRGAWWFKKCHACHLNGEYFKGGAIKYEAMGVIWYYWKGHYYSLKFTEMKFRPYQ